MDAEKQNSSSPQKLRFNDAKDSYGVQIRFTNDDITVRKVVSESLNDGTSDRNEIDESLIINGPENSSSEESDFFRSQRITKSSKKIDSSMKRKSLDNVPIILNKIIQQKFLKITQKDEQYQEDLEVNINIDSPQKPFVEGSTKTMNLSGKKRISVSKRNGQTEKQVKLQEKEEPVDQKIAMVFREPSQIPLPTKKISLEQIDIIEVDKVIKNQKFNEKKQEKYAQKIEKDKEQKVEESVIISHLTGSESEKNDTLTSKLYQKIKLLESKVQELQNDRIERAQNQLSETRMYGMIRKNDPRYLSKNQLCESESRLKSKAISVKSFQSNIFNITVSSHRKSHNQQQQFFKHKANFLQKREAKQTRMHKESEIRGVKIYDPSQSDETDEMLVTKKRSLAVGERGSWNSEIEPGKKKRVDSSAVYRRKPNSKSEEPSILQFNKEQQKFLSSKQTQILNGISKSKVCEPLLPIKIPNFTKIPSFENGEEELLKIGTACFEELGVEINKRLIKINKYSNCIQYSISQDINIIWNFDGKFYFGGWKSDKNGQGDKSGSGLDYIPNKLKYKGQFRDGKRHGFGQLQIEKGITFQGQWINGIRNGEGREIDGENMLIGKWKNGKIQGFGKIYHCDNLQYEGEFRNGNKSGKGKEYFFNGDYYQGNYLDGAFHGQGMKKLNVGFYKWKSGSTYVGEFFKGERNGQGRWESENGDSYEGAYKKDRKDGYGVYKWENGPKYEGNFAKDVKDGEGVITYKDGTRMKMTWRNGKMLKKMECKEEKRKSKRSKSTERSKIRFRTKKKTKKQIQYQYT